MTDLDAKTFWLEFDICCASHHAIVSDAFERILII
jgi:hypothetical protein